MAAVNYWLSQQASHERPKWRSQRPATPPSFHLRTPDDRDLDAVTWTRATTKSVTDYQGNVHQALSGEVTWEGYRRVRNHVIAPEDLDNGTYWSTASNVTVAAGGMTVPAGYGATAHTITEAATTASHRIKTVSNITGAANQTCILSAVIKRPTGDTRYAGLWLTNTAGTSQLRARIDPDTGTVYTEAQGNAVVDASGSEDLDGGIWRFWIVGRADTTAGDAAFYLAIVKSDGTISYAGDTGEAMVFAAPQLELARPGQTTPDEYVSNGVLSTPYHGAKVDGVKYFATDDQGRLIDGTRGYDRDGSGAWVESSSVTPIATGLSIGSSQTNRITYSSDLTSGWTDSGAGTRTAAYDAQVGVYTQLRSVGASGADDFLYAATGFTGSARTEPAMMLRAVSTSGSLVIENASDATKGKWTVDLSLVSTTRFERIDRFHAAVTVNTEFTATAGGAAGIRFYVASGSVGFDVSLVTQVEAERVQSLIYSAGSATAKNADVPAFTALPNYATNPEGTFVFDFTPKAETARQAYYVSGLLLCYKNSADDHLYQYDGTTSANYGYQVEGTRTRVATSWATGVGRYVYRDGVSQLAATAYDGAWELSTMTLVGPMLLRELSLYSSALTAAQLQALSA